MKKQSLGDARVHIILIGTAWESKGPIHKIDSFLSTYENYKSFLRNVLAIKTRNWFSKNPTSQMAAENTLKPESGLDRYDEASEYVLSKNGRTRIKFAKLN